MTKPWEIPDLHPELPVVEAARRVLLARFEHMAAQRDAVLEDSDIENLHDMRVASRRLRAAWQVFGAAFAGKHLRRHRREARTITRALGAVRDLDVMLEDLRTFDGGMPGGVRAGMPGVIASVAVARKRAFGPMREVLCAWDPTAFPPALAEAATDPFLDAVTLAHRARTALAELIAEFRVHVPALDFPAAKDEHHALRIAGKRLRYAIEIFACCLPDPIELLGILKTIQEHLGTLHDCDVMADYCGRRKPAMLPPESTALAWLVERYRERRADAYRDTLAGWKAAAATGFPETLLP